MGRVVQSLTAAQVDAIEAAHACLRSGESESARSIAEALVQEVPASADVWQILAMAYAEAGDRRNAENAFHRAHSLAPDSEVVALNFARWLQKEGRPREAAAVLETAVETPAIMMLRAKIALHIHDARQACTLYERVVAIQPEALPAWLGLGNALRALREYEAAESAFRRAVGMQPSNPLPWFGLGATLRMLGRIDQALSALHNARSLGLDSPELLNAINGTLYDAGRRDEALGGARALLQRHPDYVAGHEMLANLLWETGPRHDPAHDPFTALREAARRCPGDRELQLAFIRMLLSANQPVDALAVLEPLQREAPWDALLAWYAGETHSTLGNHGVAAKWFETADRAFHSDIAFLNARARAAFRADQPELAAACATHALRVDARHLEAWSYLGIAWRLAGDPREFWLFDYDRLIGYVDVPCPTGHADMSSFLRVLKGELETIHFAANAPINQSVRSGSQTPGRLFGREDATIGAAEAVLRNSVGAWLSTLPCVAGHPFLSRVQDRNRVVGSWSVRLQSSGRHANHIHGEGWLSSAFYVSLPPSISDHGDPAHAGWIQFGQPLEELGLDLPPRKLLRPEMGKLALFPSYMWHGTVPFDDAEPRLTIAFDIQPD